MATFVYEAAQQAPRMTTVHRPIETTTVIEHEIYAARWRPSRHKNLQTAGILTPGQGIFAPLP